MHFSTLFGLAASIASTQAVISGFNYGATLTSGAAKQESDFQAEFARAKTLQGSPVDFTSARLYTNIQSDTTDTPSAAFQAAIDTKTTLLLGIWCSAGQATVTNELNALTSAISQYGDAFTSLVVGISVGSEDLYRDSPTGIENDSGAGATPDQLVSYIQQTKAAISGTSLSGASIGHVDTWTAWVNGSNDAVTDAVDWLGVDSYPYFETTVANSISNANSTFWNSYDATAGASNGKPVWVTETGWPVSGSVSGEAVASVKNAETYWQEVGCALLGHYNTWWYTLQDAEPTTPNPSFGIVGSNLQSAPLYDLKCKKSPTTTKKGSGAATTKQPANIVGGGVSGTPYPSSNATVSGSASPSNGMTASSGSYSSASATSSGSGSATKSSVAVASQTGNSATKAGSAVSVAGILAIFGLVATL